MTAEYHSDRRHFLRNSFLLSAGGVLPVSHDFLKYQSPQKLTILHTNDTHSHIDPFPEDHPKYPGWGGVTARAVAIEKIKQRNPHVILLDAGDIFQGTAYFNRYKGTLEMNLFSQMGYDLATLGNHDFDIGMDGFLRAKQFATFDFVCANYDFKNTDLAGHVYPHRILKKQGLRIGVFGLGIELNGLVPKQLYAETQYLDPLEIAQDQVQQLSRKVDMIICLSHLGFSYDSDKVSDRVLAEKVPGIDLIIGGHTHTFMEEPFIHSRSDGSKTVIHQVGWAGLKLGHLDFYFESETRSVRNRSVIL